MRRKRRVTACLALLAAVLTAGCFRTAAEDLYSLPRAPEEYYKLQVKISEMLRGGAQYSPPTGGTNRQSVQVKDLDGDGVNEAITFLAIPGDNNPLKICVFRETEGDYVLADTIEGAGDAIESVRYLDMAGDGVSEIVVGWQMSGALRHMAIYRGHDLRFTKIAEAEYTAIAVCDLNGDLHDDVAAIRLRGESESSGMCEVFSLMSDGEVTSHAASLSADMVSISRVLTGKLADGATGVFVDGALTDTQLVTDVFAFKENRLKNVLLSVASGVSAATARLPAINTQDINRDGILEVPLPFSLPSRSQTDYYGLDWIAYDRYGVSRVAVTTYHNYWDGWYFIMPEAWRGHVAVRREDAVSGERVIIFSYVNGIDPQVDFLRVFTLSGANKEDRAALPGRFRLLADGDTLYAADVTADAAVPIRMDEQAVADGFRRIYSDWITGAV